MNQISLLLLYNKFIAGNLFSRIVDRKYVAGIWSGKISKIRIPIVTHRKNTISVVFIISILMY